jgi:hypothetical protein
VLEAIFGALVKDLTAEPLYQSFRRGFGAMVDQEVETTEMGKPMFKLFTQALSHLRNAAREPPGSITEHQHIELACKTFVQAAQLDNSLVAARASFYAGFCHRLLEQAQELSWYERSLEMVSAIGARVARKAMSQSLPLASVTARSDSPMVDYPALFAIACRRCLQKNFRALQQTVREHEEAVAAIVKKLKEQPGGKKHTPETAFCERPEARGSAWRLQ